MAIEPSNDELKLGYSDYCEDITYRDDEPKWHMTYVVGMFVVDFSFNIYSKVIATMPIKRLYIGRNIEYDRAQYSQKKHFGDADRYPFSYSVSMYDSSKDYDRKVSVSGTHFEKVIMGKQC